MLAKLKSLGSGLLGIAIMLGFLLLIVLLINGAGAVGAWAYPFILRVSSFATVFVLPILVVLALIPATRGISGGGPVSISYLYGLALWVWALLYTLQTWGWIAVVIGILMAGVGVVPIAMLAGALHSQWSIVGQLVFMLVLTYGCRMAGFALDASAKKRSARLQSAAI